MATGTTDHQLPKWLRFIMICDRAGSSWYIGTGFFFAPVLALLSPWQVLTTALWVLIAVAGLWLGLLGVAMAAGLALMLRSDTEIPEDYWRSLLDYPGGSAAAASARPGSPTGRCSRPASA